MSEKIGPVKFQGEGILAPSSECLERIGQTDFYLFAGSVSKDLPGVENPGLRSEPVAARRDFAARIASIHHPALPIVDVQGGVGKNVAGLVKAQVGVDVQFSGQVEILVRERDTPQPIGVRGLPVGLPHNEVVLQVAAGLGVLNLNRYRIRPLHVPESRFQFYIGKIKLVVEAPYPLYGHRAKFIGDFGLDPVVVVGVVEAGRSHHVKMLPQPFAELEIVFCGVERAVGRGEVHKIFRLAASHDIDGSP